MPRISPSLCPGFRITATTAYFSLGASLENVIPASFRTGVKGARNLSQACVLPLMLPV
jgi:hypothetical protein